MQMRTFLARWHGPGNQPAEVEKTWGKAALQHVCQYENIPVITGVALFLLFSFVVQFS